MEDTYQYNKYKFVEKLYTPIGILMAGILLQFFYPGIGFYQKLLIYLIYLSAVLLFAFDTLAVIISIYSFYVIWIFFIIFYHKLPAGKFIKFIINIFKFSKVWYFYIFTS